MESNPERRRFFRVDLMKPIDTQAIISLFQEHELSDQKAIPMSILDLSASGMRLECLLDLPINDKYHLKITFFIEEEKFDVVCELLRKRKLINKTEYGAKIVKQTAKEEIILIRKLNLLKIKQTKFNDYQQKLIKESGSENIVKMMDLLPGMTCLMNSQRVIIAVNQNAQQQGINIGQRCYHAIYKNNKICEDCRFYEAFDNDNFIKEKSYNGQEIKTWLNLGTGIFLYNIQKIPDQDNNDSNNSCDKQ